MTTTAREPTAWPWLQRIADVLTHPMLPLVGAVFAGLATADDIRSGKPLVSLGAFAWALSCAFDRREVRRLTTTAVAAHSEGFGAGWNVGWDRAVARLATLAREHGYVVIPIEKAPPPADGRDN